METCLSDPVWGLAERQEAKTQFAHLVTRHTMVHEQMHFFVRGFRRDAHPMAVLTGVVGALSAFYHDALDINNPEHRKISAFRLIAKLPTIVAMAYKYNMGQPFIYPRNDLSYSANFMHMMFGTPAEEYKVNDVLVRALDRILILHADHEQNASTSTVRLAGSSGANPFACIAAGIACLWGPAHGGANEAVLNMLEEIGDVKKIPALHQARQGQERQAKLMGFGHRVYKNYDPRAKLMRRRPATRCWASSGSRTTAVQAGDGAGKDRAGRRLLRPAQALSERRFLLGHRLQGARHSGEHVHRDFRAGAHHGLDCAMEGTDR